MNNNSNSSNNTNSNNKYSNNKYGNSKCTDNNFYKPTFIETLKKICLIKPNLQQNMFKICGLIHKIKKYSFEVADFTGLSVINFNLNTININNTNTTNINNTNNINTNLNLVIKECGLYKINCRIGNNSKIYLVDFKKIDVYEEMIFWYEAACISSINNK